MSTYLLGIDLGGTITKAALFTLAGDEVKVVSKKAHTLQIQATWSERDASLLWDDCCEIIRELLSTGNIDPEHILALACTGYGNGLYMVDEKGVPVRNAINSSDTRAIKYVEEWKESKVNEKVLPYTAQSLWAGQPNALLAWLQDHEPEVLQKANALFMVKDFIRMKLTDEVYAEMTDMSATSLLNVMTKQYDDEILQHFGIEELKDLLPPLISSTALAGKVTQQAATLTGLKEGTLVAGGMFDVDACALASGICKQEQMSLVVGTWGNNQYIADKPIIDKDFFMSSVYSIEGKYLMLEGSPTSASNLDWFIHTFLSNEKKEKGEQFFDWLNEEVASIDVDSSAIIFLPFLFGNNEKGNLKAGFYGIEGHHTKAQMIRAVYEGIVFSHKTHIQNLLRYRELPKVIRCTGGASQSDVWMQMFADIIGVPIEIPQGTQLGALGAAMAAAVVSDTYQNLEEACQKMTRIKKCFEPNKTAQKQYHDKWLAYKAFIGSLDN